MTRLRQGFSVLEVLVAFVIMALVFAVLLPGQSGALSRVSRTTDMALAADILASQAALLRVPGAAADTVALPPGWSLSMKVTPETRHQRRGVLTTVTLSGPQGRRLGTRSVWQAQP